MAYIFCQKATHAQVPMYQVKIDNTLCTKITGAIAAYKDDMNVDKQSTVWHEQKPQFAIIFHIIVVILCSILKEGQHLCL